MWELELRIARGLIIKDECIVKRYSKIVNRKNSTSGLVGGQVESAEAKPRRFCGLGGNSTVQ
jgi:hypothetical protein